MKDVLYWIWYSIRCGAGSVDGVRLLERFDGDPKAIFESSDSKRPEFEGLDPAFLGRLGNKNLDGANRVLEFCFMNDIRILTCGSEDYPSRLRGLYNRPIVLYARGKIENLEKRLCVAVVGTRGMTDYGKHAVFDIVRSLCGYGAVIISGAAYGVDSVAHRTALFFDSDTAAVLGSGVNVPYPRENAPLIDEIAQKGMLLSEYVPGTAPNGRNFPMRNRIISGLADAVLVVEADLKSGALITARLAADQGRAVYAVPGNIDQPSSRGANNLIRDGAKLCTRAEDIIEDFADEYQLEQLDSVIRSEKYIRYEMRSRSRMAQSSSPVQNHRDRSAPKPGEPPKESSLSEPERKPEPEAEVKSRQKESEKAPKKRRSEPAKAAEPRRSGPDTGQDAPVKSVNSRECIYSKLGETEKKVFDALPDEGAVTSDKLSSTGLPASEVLAALTVLELYAAVESLPGGLYRKIV